MPGLLGPTSDSSTLLAQLWGHHLSLQGSEEVESLVSPVEWPVQGVSVLWDWMCSVAWRGLPVVPIVPIPTLLPANIHPILQSSLFGEPGCSPEGEDLFHGQGTARCPQ